jgi:hypothetical protein
VGVFQDKMKKDWTGDDDATLMSQDDDYMVIKVCVIARRLRGASKN